MTSAGRITREARSVQNADLPFFRALEVDETDLNRWTGLLLPTNAPYNTSKFNQKVS
jgi:ubiquitin-protein ligase